ncbi:MAG: competence/damage-inducible protein A, partial [Thermodesulfobacteriota bacterium]
MKIEIITTGDELMCGLTIDTNFRWAADSLLSLGFDIKYHTTVGDDKDAIFEALRISQQRSQAVIVSGGLGPTPDDLTAEVASRFFEVPLELNEMALGILEKRFRERGMELLEINKKQAYIPK